MTHDEFVHLLNDVYCPQGYNPDLIQIEPETARILTKTGTQDRFALHFAKSDATACRYRVVERAERLIAHPGAGPLAGLHIALDPGHLGGTWAQMEERWFKIGDAPPVQEGDMTLRVAQLLASRLESLGAKVSLLRQTTEPITPYRPSDFEEDRPATPVHSGISDPRESFDGPADPEKEHTIAWQREQLFYRNSEIRRRASLVNYRLQPDLVLCLHFNAEPWGDPSHPTWWKNHLHLLVNGTYLPAELELDDQRFEMLQKLLSRAFPEELTLAETIAHTMAKKTGLPPYQYTTRERHAGRRERIRLRTEPAGHPALSLPDGLSGTLRDEQPGRLRPRQSRRLRRRPVSPQERRNRAFIANMWTASSMGCSRILAKAGRCSRYCRIGSDSGRS